MNAEELRDRTKAFNVAIIKACENMPRNAAGFELAKQIIRSAGSVGANYRASRRAKSDADFIYKIEIVTEEADETLYWLEVITESGILPDSITKPLKDEANELVRIFVATAKTVKTKTNKKRD